MKIGRAPRFVLRSGIEKWCNSRFALFFFSCLSEKHLVGSVAGLHGLIDRNKHRGGLVMEHLGERVMTSIR
jgi:hypothetical protein